MVDSKYLRDKFIAEIYKILQRIKLGFIRKIPLWNYTFLPKTVNVSETFLEAILWKKFQHFIRIRENSSIMIKASSFNADFSRGNI